MISALIVLLALLLLTIFYLQTQPRIHRQGQRLRSAPDTLPLLGNAIKFLQPRHLLFDWFVQCEQEFGDETFQISVPSLPPGVVINDPTNLEFVLKNEASITKGDFFKKRSWDLFGYGIINASGELWKAQRKAGLKFFAGTNLDVMVDEVLPEICARTRKTLLEVAEEGQVIDMAKVFLDLTTAVMEIDASSPFSKAFDYASDHVGLRFQNPLYPITELFTGFKFQNALLEVKRFGRRIVTNAKARRGHIAFDSLISNDEPVFGTLIDSLIETFEQPKVVADAALNFLSAGRDTTAQSLTWSLYCLLRHPQYIGPIRNETETLHTTATGITTKDENQPDGIETSIPSLTTAHLQPASIPLLTSTFYESLRLYPPVPFELKQCETDTTLPDGTFLPRTSIVVWCIWAMNRSPRRFGPDAATFRPSRWLDSDSGGSGNGNFVVKSAFEFPVFNAGPRACLGKKMAETMVTYVLAVLLWQFDFEEVFDDDGDISGQRRERVSQNSLTLPMKGGLPCRVKLRATTPT